jgi:hypothetical protein
MGLDAFIVCGSILLLPDAIGRDKFCFCFPTLSVGTGPAWGFQLCFAMGEGKRILKRKGQVVIFVFMMPAAIVINLFY